MKEKSKNSVAVIIPLYNGAPWIEETIKSVLSQSLKPDEIIVVDDNSTDEGYEIVKKYKEVTLVKNEGKGSSMSRNLGTKLSKSRFIAFLDQDDLWHPSHLRLLRNALLDNSESNSVIAIANSFEKNPPKYDFTTKGCTYFDPWTRYPFTIGVEGPSVALIRREILFDIGLWEEKSTGMGDAILFLKLSSQKPLLKLQSCTVGKRVHAGSQWIAIRDWGAKYLNFRHQVMRSALDFRTNINSNDPFLPEFELKLKALKTLQHLTHSIAEQDHKNVVEYANLLETQLSNVTDTYMAHVFYCLMGALFPIHDSEKLKIERDHVFTELLKIWSDEAPKTKMAIQNLIGEKPLVS
ncbi:glycosyltransferase family A protein [Fulvivirgaceae bacterium BMA10]|uniref:Glycosyltransferase family A protein n=1 Tax=Splendidivirga corallicola TaxID=3051826 RepID=A0ABT8KL99_9BACT|nr:glycosyltransferase family A protein [Fulvivirgaceae bacterium BMA10]